MSHSAKAIVIHCIDFRFITGLKNYLHKDLGLRGQYDKVSIAGAAKNLVDPTHPHDVEVVLRQIEISQRLHAITEVLLINHKDCGAYGNIFASPEEEERRHHDDLAKAAILIKERFPRLMVKTMLAGLTEDSVQVDPVHA